MINNAQIIFELKNKEKIGLIHMLKGKKKEGGLISRSKYSLL